MVSAIYQRESATGTHMSPSRLTSLGGQSTGFGFPASHSKFPQSVSLTYGNLYVQMPLSQIIPLSPSPLCPKVLELALLSIIHFFLLRQKCRMTDFKACNICRCKISLLPYVYSCKQITFFWNPKPYLKLTVGSHQGTPRGTSFVKRALSSKLHCFDKSKKFFFLIITRAVIDWVPVLPVRHDSNLLVLTAFPNGPMRRDGRGQLPIH